MSEQQVEQIGNPDRGGARAGASRSPDGPRVGIIMGSASDMETMQKAGAVLREAEIPYEIEVMSAHRDPERVAEYCRSARSRGLRVIIAGAGPVGRAARRRRGAHGPAGHRRPALRAPERRGRAGRDPVGRPDAAGGARWPRSGWTTRATPPTSRSASWVPERARAGGRAPRPQAPPDAWARSSSDAFALFGAHSGVFFTATLLVVAPVTVLVDGVWGRMLADGVDAHGAGRGDARVDPADDAADPAAGDRRARRRGHGPGQGVAADARRRAARARSRSTAPLLAVLLLFALAVLGGLVLLDRPRHLAEHPVVLRAPGRRRRGPARDGRRCAAAASW